MTKAKTQAEKPDFFAAMVEKFEVDPSKTVDFTLPGVGVLHIHYAGSSNAAFAKATKENIDRNPNAKSFTKEQMTAFMTELYANHIVVGISDPDGNKLPYGAAEKKRLAAALVKLPEVFEQLITDAQNAALFRATRRGDNAKN